MQSLSKMHEVTPKQRPPTADEIRAAAGCRIPDLIAPGLKVLFCGINPGLYSAATKHHFARPGNRFWPALHLAKFTPRLLAPNESGDLLDRVRHHKPGAACHSDSARGDGGGACGRQAQARPYSEHLPPMLGCRPGGWCLPGGVRSTTRRGRPAAGYARGYGHMAASQPEWRKWKLPTGGSLSVSCARSPALL